MDWGLPWPWLYPWRGALAALLLALGVVVCSGRMWQPRLAGLAAGFGILAGWWVTFGLLTATPRQLPERLPLLALGLLLLAWAGGAAASRWRAAAPMLAGLGVLGIGWWMGGAPLGAADLARAAPVVLCVVAYALALLLRPGGRVAGVMAAGLLLAGLLAAAAPGPGVVLGAVAFAAALGAAAGRAAPSARLGSLPLAGGLAALGAMPVIARGAAADWVAAAVPLAGLWLGPMAARFLPRWTGPILSAVLVALPLVTICFFLR